MTENSREDTGHSAATATGKKVADWVIANRNNWVRGILMLVFAFVLGLLKLVVGLMALFQFGSLLLTGEPNRPLQNFGRGLAIYGHDLIAYLTCASDHLPFPFTEWPRQIRSEA